MKNQKSLKSTGKKWSALHHEVWRTLNSHLPAPLKNSKFLLCVSGGSDSVALFHIMKDLPIKIEVFHAHHGPGDNLRFRDTAQNFVKQICEQEKIPFHGTKSRTEMKSENDFRKFRISFLKEWNQKHLDHIIVMAHHTQDLLETRMMRLIRGTGPQGLQSMKIWKAPVFRPFLEMDRKKLKDFLKERNLDWCEDPTNKNTHYFRNWMRYRWLPILEKARPGGLKRLSASLENLSAIGAVASQTMPNKSDMKRSDYITLNQKDQIQHLALLLKSQGMTQFTSGQLKEVQKRLDNLNGRLIFKAAGALWTVNAQRILVERI